MSDDGADLGVGAEKALGTVLGGDQPTEEDKQTVEQMRERILTTPIEGPHSYDECATACARVILEAFEEYPMLKDHPTERQYLKDKAGATVYKVKLRPDLHDILQQLHPKESAQGKILEDLTGFMWGWALNAARRCIGANPVPNPAIVTIGVPDETA